MTDDRAFVAFPFDLNGEEQTENMFAIPLPDGTFVLDNSPFYVQNISFGDRFSVERQDCLIFNKVIERGGHSTYRVRLPKNATHVYFLTLWPPLERMGCTYEGSSVGERRLYSIDVPPGKDVKSVYDYLTEVEQGGRWQFEEGHYFALNERPIFQDPI